MLRPQVLFVRLAPYVNSSGHAWCIVLTTWTALVGAPTPYSVNIASILFCPAPAAAATFSFCVAWVCTPLLLLLLAAAVALPEGLDVVLCGAGCEPSRIRLTPTNTDSSPVSAVMELATELATADA
jgi:hypothetical protein